MAVQSNKLPTLHALLIGISCYLPNRLPNGKTYKSLSGCVRDIAQIEDYLRRTRGVPPERITKLTATATGSHEPYEPLNQWPTYENIVLGFRSITEAAQPGDQVYIHYSGHGGRTKTMLPDLKGENGIDETLVPTNIGFPQARYFHDVELAYLLQKMVKKGLLVTVVLDSCHSGGATRGREKATVRGSGTIDTTPRLQDSLVASKEELSDTWGSLLVGTSRSALRESGWLPKPKDYVLLAACLSYEKAYEFAFDGKRKSGALTYWLLDSLKQSPPGLTYNRLHGRLVAKIHEQFRDQTPILEGDGNRVIFGEEHIQGQYAITVMRTDEINRRVLLNTGQVHPLGKDAQFTIFPAYEMDAEKLVLVTLSQLGATDSWATITRQFRSDIIEAGAQAVLENPGSGHLRSDIKLLYQDPLLPASDHDVALKSVEDIINQSETGFLQQVNGDVFADYLIAINEKEEYVIKESHAHAPLHLHPELRTSDPQAPLFLVRRLTHITKYNNVKTINNIDPQSPLANKLKVELLGKQREYDLVDQPKPEAYRMWENIPQVSTGEWLFVRICNDSIFPLNISVLKLQCDWSITQIPLFDGGIYFMPFDPGKEHILPLQVDLPDGYGEGKELIKIFGTRGTTSFRWLELPPLDQPPPLTRGRGKLETLAKVLKTVFLTIDDPQMEKYRLSPSPNPSSEWITTQIEVLVKRFS